MLTLPLCLILAASGFGPSTSTPTQPLPGPPAPQQTINPPSSGSRPAQKPPISHPPIAPRQILDQKLQERGQETSAQGPLYVYPGVVKAKDGKWAGFDYLYNVGSNIPIEVTIIKPPEASVPVSEESIRLRINEEFQKANIDTTVNTSGGHPPAALFSMMILIYPVNDGFIALCDGRLIETVSVQRVTPASTEGVFQAITWEHKNLIVAPTDSFNGLLSQTVDTIARTFIERYKFFESFRKRKEGGVVQ